MFKKKSFKITLLFLSFLFISLLSVYFVFSCTGSSCSNNNGNTITCSDTDATAEIPSGRNVFLKGKCMDHTDTSGEKHKDSCSGLAYLNEWYCYQCTEPSCTLITKYPCEYGCSDGACMTLPELKNKFDINVPEDKNKVFCIDGDGPDYPDLPPLKDSGCGDGGNNRNNFSKDSFCIDQSGVYFDKCDGGAVDYYCSDGGFCIARTVPCEGGCFQGTCNYVPPKKGFCLNPNSDACTYSYEDICCPKDRSDYIDENGPKDYDECVDDFFITGNVNVVQKEKCELVCCCELYYDDENKKQVDAYQEYKISCSGQDQSIYIGNDCSKEACSSKYKDAPDSINSFRNRWLNNIKEGRGCKSGTCAKDLFCLADLNDDKNKICCKEGNCVNNSLCVKNNTINIKDGIQYVCQNSKWISIQKEEKPKRGCSFFPDLKSPPDIGLISILLYLAVFSLIKFFRFSKANLTEKV